VVVVLDANIFVSAVISSQGPSATLLKAARDGVLDVVVSPHLLQEVRDVLHRPRFRRYLTTSEADEYLEELARICRLSPDPEEQAPILRDRSDDYLVYLATESGAEFIVSGDADLTDDKELSLSAITPREAVDLLDLD